MGKKGENREKTNIAAVEKKVKIGGLGGSRGKNGGINRVGNVEGSVLDRIYRMGRIRFWWPCVPSKGRGGSPLPPARIGRGEREESARSFIVLARVNVSISRRHKELPFCETAA